MNSDIYDILSAAPKKFVVYTEDKPKEIDEMIDELHAMVSYGGS